MRFGVGLDIKNQSDPVEAGRGGKEGRKKESKGGKMPGVPEKNDFIKVK